MTSFNFNDRFEYPALTRITGALNLKKLNWLKNELKTDASSIQSNLRGGMNSHLGIITTAIEYTSIDIIPYAQHVNPPLPTILRGTQQHKVNRWKEEHKEHKMRFREQVALGKTLLKIMSDALPVIYLQP